ncbi:uncharacterized protein FOMMEDRAFT_158015 [Fomitiporia mediterranea MF3/22]|uniref:uncharacterized protein n=1 Tax=Fomitiporia mediterranea (strain MF3/22) TaxID=694068 RepID=UPI0004407984|nr:uncharacterized protein FOMMEDRAFT_158015 [Fomitiporia mediterranea MF3/22]EJD00900.1 hypothetical protein FOMMEDRAFT_158015 [Fomitiporia mediterranea MF3/22]
MTHGYELAQEAKLGRRRTGESTVEEAKESGVEFVCFCPLRLALPIASPSILRFAPNYGVLQLLLWAQESLSSLDSLSYHTDGGLEIIRTQSGELSSLSHQTFISAVQGACNTRPKGQMSIEQRSRICGVLYPAAKQFDIWGMEGRNGDRGMSPYSSTSNSCFALLSSVEHPFWASLAALLLRSRSIGRIVAPSASGKLTRAAETPDRCSSHEGHTGA